MNENGILLKQLKKENEIMQTEISSLKKQLLTSSTIGNERAGRYFREQNPNSPIVFE